MSQSITDRRRRIRRAVTAGSAALLAGAWGVVAVSGKGAGTSSAATPATTAGDDATATQDPAYSDPAYSDPGYTDPGYDDGASAQDQAPPITSSQS